MTTEETATKGEVERFDDCEGVMGPDPDGPWVRYEDHASRLEQAEAERDRAVKFHTAEYRDRRAAEAERDELKAELAEAWESARLWMEQAEAAEARSA